MLQCCLSLFLSHLMSFPPWHHHSIWLHAKPGSTGMPERFTCSLQIPTFFLCPASVLWNARGTFKPAGGGVQPPGPPSLFGSFFCFFTCLPGMELSEIRSITHTFAVAHTRSLSLSFFQSNSLRILILLLHLLASIYFYLLSCRTLYFTDLAKPIGTDSMNIPTASLPAPLSFLKGSSFNLTARSEVALRPFPEIVQPSIKTLEIFNKNYLGLVFLVNATQGVP